MEQKLLKLNGSSFGISLDYHLCREIYWPHIFSLILLQANAPIFTKPCCSCSIWPRPMAPSLAMQLVETKEFGWFNSTALCLGRRWTFYPRGCFWLTGVQLCRARTCQAPRDSKHTFILSSLVPAVACVKRKSRKCGRRVRPSGSVRKAYSLRERPRAEGWLMLDLTNIN